MTDTIRDLRESKNLSQDKVAEAAGLTYSKFVRIEEGSGKTTQAEVDAVLEVLRGMEPGTRRLAGRPFKDPERQAAVKAARESGGSVAAALGLGSGRVVETVDPDVAAGDAPAETPTPAKATRKGKGKADTGLANALAKKAPARSRSRRKAAPAEAEGTASSAPETDAGTSSVSSLLP